MTIKNFVLDTNVLLHDPRALFQFEDNNVVIPIYVIEELDQFKKDINELGRSARQVSRFLDQYRQEGNISKEGVKLPDGGILRILFADRNPELSSIFQDPNHPDSKILAVALRLCKEDPEHQTILISKDTNLRIRADAVGLHAQDFDPEAKPIDELYPGSQEIEVPGGFIDQLYQSEQIQLDDVQALLPNPAPTEANNKSNASPLNNTYAFFANQFLTFRAANNPQHSGLARIEPDGKTVRPFRPQYNDVWGIQPRNKEQRFALELLLDPRIKLVTLVGKAGTGKTLLAIAAGLHNTMDQELYQRLLVSRPVFPMGRDLGFLPGGLNEKLGPWMQPIFDNVELLMGLNQKDKRNGRSYQELIDMGTLHIEALTYIRGRSIPRQYMIVDEAQNLTPHEVKTIISRAGEDTKIVLTGDPYQIDHPYLDSSSNGLVYVVNRFQNQAIAGHITLQKGERSKLAELAANLL
ncbi:MAG: PhoH family protein [Myxococcales bacterium]|nr:PhoH family protein [Myxococcales bacterium]